MSIAVEIKNLSKHYKNVIALSELSLDIRQGEIFGLIGPNGAGKSTTLKILTTLLTPTSGSATIFGVDVSENPKLVRTMISYLPEEAGSYKQLTGREYLEFMAGLLELPDEQSRAEVVKRGVGIASLGERIDDKTKEYSKGMRRKLLIARALMSKPRLAVLDEPASGLDVKHAYYVRGIVKEYVRDIGITVLLSSHNMLEVEYLCDRVGLLDEGKLLDVGTPKELIAKYSAENLEEVFIKATSDMPEGKGVSV
ncbi:MAG: ABC transporter ATP-binding protein [Candidatus Thermoplasmatota archaeon]|nr:ABC transporter ATP-binding protein [Euryarchaeota archaeon]MBU4032497.1 ABC transporter ATP-binding protein [Candidatus Thermoplasmatota archaeon]MBU4070987.1 ABC transporter ATP-binding protein [Candidatus Thermoplasmatota archaeon]MBU4144295.1 ABC transporter ATP-binding protein [Candidatus Thermoplasmatota archaeon]MBU4592615.1 ABC transporter ATP-binding protein [Candidatus Thermoplasmatota archaeon]